MTPSEKGAMAELAVATALTRSGRPVYVPFFNAHSRVDLVYETTSGEFRRVQCKLARLIGDAVRFYTCSHTGGVEREYLEDADDFGVYCLETGIVYIVPVAEVPIRVASLRLAPDPQQSDARSPLGGAVSARSALVTKTVSLVARGGTYD
jgi:hypothetical protein